MIIDGEMPRFFGASKLWLNTPRPMRPCNRDLTQLMAFWKYVQIFAVVNKIGTWVQAITSRIASHCWNFLFLLEGITRTLSSLGVSPFFKKPMQGSTNDHSRNDFFSSVDILGIHATAK